MGFFQGTQERIRNSRGNRTISVRATEVLLYSLFLNDYITLQAVLEFAPNPWFVCFCKCIHKAKVSVGQSGIQAHHVTGGASLSPFTALNFPLIRKKILRLLERERDRFSSRQLAEIGCEPTAQRAFGAKMTSCQRRCDVITSHRRRHNVILAPNARWGPSVT